MVSLECLALLSPVLRTEFPVIKCLQNRNLSSTILVSTGNQFLFLFEGRKLLLTFKFEADVVHVDPVSEHGSFVVTKDGRLSFITLDNKPRYSSDDGGQNQHHIESRNQEIFSELLNNSSGELVDKDVSSFKQNFSIGTLINIPAAAAVLYKPGMLNILSISSSLIITGGVNEMGCSVSVHSVVGLDNRNDPVMHEGITASALCQSTVLLNRFTEPLKSLVLMCIWPSGSLSNPPLQSTLDRAVFQQLFGSEISLFDSSVLLIGLSSGHIYYFPLAEGVTCHKEELKQTFLSQDESREKTRSFSLVPSLLFCLEQPVSAVYLANIPFEREQKSKERNEKRNIYCSNCVLFIGKRDKLLVSYQNKSSDRSRNEDFAVCQIPGPVCCSAMEAFTNVLIHSTGKEIFVSKIELQKTELSPTAHSEHVVVKTVHCIEIPFVCAMVHVRSTTIEPGTDEIIVLTLKGKLEKLKISNALDSSSFSLRKMSPKIAGNKIKCFLSDISRTSEKLSQLKLSINEEDAILKELNVATSFICSVMDKEQLAKDKYLNIKESSNCDDHGIHCSVKSSVSCEGNLTGPLVNIQCKVTNNCNVTFCKGWSLLVQVRVAEQGTFNFTGSQRMKSKAVPLQKFAAGQHVILEFLLDSLTPFYSVKINFFLHFDLNAILSKLSSSLSSESVVVPLSVKYLDVIDFLRPLSKSINCFEFQGSSQINRQSLQQKISAAVKNVESLFSSQIMSLESAPNNTTTSMRSPQTLHQFVLPLSENCVHYIYQHILTNKDIYNAKESVTVQEAVLLFLTVRNKALLLDCGQGSIRAETPTGEQAELYVCRRSASTDDVQEDAIKTDYCKLELVLRSSVVQLLCCLHEAVLTRLQKAMQRSTLAEKMIPSHNVLPILERVKDIQCRLEEIENSFSAEERFPNRFPAEKSSPTSLQESTALAVKLVELFLELRQNMLPIT